MRLCQHCGKRQVKDGNSCGTCRRSAFEAAKEDARTDWLRVRLTRDAIRKAWPKAERKGRLAMRPQPVVMPVCSVAVEGGD